MQTGRRGFVTIPKRTAAAAALVAMGVLASGLPAEAAVQRVVGPVRRTGACSYRPHPAKPSSNLELRSGSGTRYRVIGRLWTADSRFTGSCRSTRGWTKVTGANGEVGWVPRRSLRLVGHRSHVALRCMYWLTRVRRGSHLHVRTGPGMNHRIVGRLRPADGRFVGSCGSTRNWRRVETARGRIGWASAHYLRRVSK
jgi:uncharacterized protein YraI